MQLRCEVCDTPLPPDDVDLGLALARCRACNAVYSLEGRRAEGLSPRPAAPVRPPAPLPTRFVVEDDGQVLRVQWRWFRPSALALLLFCAVWDGFLVMFYTGMVLGNAPAAAFAFPLVHLAVGVGLTYVAVAQLANRTAVEVRSGTVTVRHRPLPWRGNRTWAREELRQLYGARRVQRSKGQVTGHTFDLCGLDVEGRTRTLLSGLTEQEQVLWLEQALEKRLGILDKPVDGEVARRTG